MEERIANSIKYFLFKIKDYVSNNFHYFEKKRMESLELLITTCLNTYNEFVSDPANDRVEKAFLALAEGLLFVFECHPFGRLKLFMNDFSTLRALITDRMNKKNIDNRVIYRALGSLLKKIKSNNIMRLYVDVLKGTNVFKDVDILICFMLSDLLYKGYSLKYIDEWINENFMGNPDFYHDIEEGNIEKYIDLLAGLNFSQNEYKLIRKIIVHESIMQKVCEAFGLSNCNILSSDDDIIHRDVWLQDNDCIYLQVEICACDIYKAIMLANKTINEIITNFKLVLQNCIRIKDVNAWGLRNNDSIQIVDNRIDQSESIMRYVDKRQREMVDSYLNLRFVDGICNDDMLIIQSVLFTFENVKMIDSQNRFTNYWSALEYISYSYPRNSIIEKIRTIVPLSLCLYFIKDRLNIFWERFLYHVQKPKAEPFKEVYDAFTRECVKEQGSTEYDTRKLCVYLSDNVKASTLRDALNIHSILQRELMELNFLLTNHEGLLKEIEFYRQTIECDLNLIYRFRNQIVHSTGNMDEYLDFVSLRLLRYINSVLATVLYYKKLNNNITISEVLNSIYSTYEFQYNSIKDGSAFIDMYSLVRPHYLYIE